MNTCVLNTEMNYFRRNIVADLYLALIHAPVYNKNMQVVATSITNLDLHDIARCAATFGVKRYYVVHPAPAQQALAKRIMAFWQEGYGAEYNPDRREAFAGVRLVADLAAVAAEVEELEGVKPLRVATDARRYPNTVTYADLRERMRVNTRPVLLMFGTGWGLIQEVIATADLILEPIYGPGEYNHLSVRSAAAIILDRLCGH